MTNFRAVKMGGIAEGVLYRSEHPAPYGDEDERVVTLAQEARINCIVNLHDTATGLHLAAEGSPWYGVLTEQGKARAFNLTFDFDTGDFRKKLRKALLFMLAHDGPYLVHCYAGVDRTGIMCAILEALMGAAPDEIAADYTRSFYNGADSAIYTGDKRDAGRQILSQLDAAFGAEVHNAQNLALFAGRFLTEKLRMTCAQVETLKAHLADKG
jgi:protein tyrosine/serine phosphatase